MTPPKLARGETYLSIDSPHVARLSAMLTAEPHIDIVLTSSWVGIAGFRFVLGILPDSIRRLVVGATVPGNKVLRRQLKGSSGKSEWLAADVRRREPQIMTVLESDARHVPTPLRDEAVIVTNGLWAAEFDDWSRLRRMLLRTSRTT
ncbi:HAD domain-containing protein [Paraburkholderia dipogonis]|uniref:hypothetical protein n=1 Tax=Paraburkholderia dipogonis TaxID=1211383 RepID=UPI0038BDCD48